MKKWSMIGSATCAMAGFVLADVPGAVVTNAPASLVELGFLERSWLLKAAGSFDGLLDGPYNLQVNDVAAGGAAVTLSNTANSFAGGVYIASGMLSVPGAGALGGGSRTAPIAMGAGTLRFTGSADVDRDLYVMPATGKLKSSSIVRVDEGATVRHFGHVRSADDKYGNFLKTGSGTFVLATGAAGTTNRIGSYAQHNGMGRGQFLNLPANGDGPTTANPAFGVANGRFVIDTADAVTNYFGGEAWVGGASTDAANAETAGHLDIYGGVNLFYSWLAVSRHNGTTTSAPQGLVSTLNVYGGETTCKDMNLDYADDTSYTSHAEVNVHGGSLTATGTLRIDHAASDATVNVDDGTMTVGSVNVGYYRDGAKLDLNVSGDGAFVCRGAFAAPHHNVTINVRATDGGTFATREVTVPADSPLSLHFDGGRYRFFQQSNSSGYNAVLGAGTLYVGAKGATFDVSETYNWGPRWNIAITNEPGVVDGGLEFVNTASTRQCFRFDTDDITLAGGIRAHSNVELVLKAGDYRTAFSIDEGARLRPCGDVSLDVLAFPGKEGFLTLAVMGEGTSTTNIGLCTIRDFTPPSGYLRVEWIKADTTSPLRHYGTYDVLKFPASVDFDASRMFFMQDTANYEYRLTDRVEDGWRIISFTAKASGSADGLDPRASDAWQTGTDGWEIGPWLYVHGAGSLTTAAPLELTPAKNQYAGISVPEDVALTLAGGLHAQHGGFAKMGAGDLAFAGDKGYVFGIAYTSTQNLGTSLEDLGIFDGTTNGAPCVQTHNPQVVVGRGTLALGNGTDDPLLAMYNGGGFLAVGSSTTSAEGGEGDAAMVMNSGRLHVYNRELVVGFSHGTPATRSAERLASSFTMNGGTADVYAVQMACDTTKNASMDARFIMNGGDFRCRRHFYLGNADPASPAAHVLLRMNGGHLSVGREIHDTASSSEGRLIGKYNGPADMQATFEMNGGEAEFWDGFSFYNGGVCNVNLNGGRLAVAETFNGGNGTTLNWNGGVLAPIPGAAYAVPYFRYFNLVNIGPGDGIIDLSALTGSSGVEIQQVLTGTGRLVVRGADTNTAVKVRTYVAHTIPGAVVEKGGLYMIIGSSGKADISTLPVTVKDGGGFAGYYGYAAYSLTLGEAATDTTAFYSYSISGSFLTTVVTNSFTVNGTVQVAFRKMDGELLLPTGTKAVLTAPKGSIDPAKFTLHPFFANQGAAATFEVASLNDAYDQLTMTVTQAPTAVTSTWTANASGRWSDAANWDMPPAGTATDSATFPATLGADISVTDATHVQTLRQDSAHAVRIASPLAFDAAAAYDVANSNGVLELAGRVAVADALTSSRTRAAGTLRVTGQIAGSPVIAAKSGRIEGAPGAFGTATLDLANTTVRFTESGTCRAFLLHGTSDATGLGVEVPEGKTVYATGGMSNMTAFVKTGPGTVVFTGGGDNVLCGSQKSYTTVPYKTGDNGDVWQSHGMGIYAGTVVIDGNYRTVSTAERFVGFHPILDGTGGAYDARLEIRGGTVSFPSTLSIGRTLTADDSPANLGLTRRPLCALDIYGGDLTVNAIIMNYCNYKYRNWMRSEINVHGGSLTITSGRFAVTHEGTDVRPYDADNESVVSLYDGLIDMKYAEDVRVNYYPSNASTSRPYPARGIIDIYGGLFRTTAGKGIDLAYGNGHGSLNLHGGVLETGYIKRTTPDGTYKAAADVYFNGGLFRPLASGKELAGFTTFAVGEGGARFDLGEANALTIGQALTTTNGIVSDGGIALTATTADALLTLKVANAFNGPLTVNGGTMRPTVAAAASCAAGVEVNNGGVFDANGFGFTFGFLRGEGGVYSNGTVTVTGEVAPSNTTFTVADLVLADGAVLKCPVSGNAAQGWTAPYLTVAGSVAKAGDAFLDLGHDADDPLAKGCRVKVAELAPGVDAFPSLRATGIGLPGASASLSRQAREDGVTEIWAEVVPPAFMLIFR